MNIDRLDAPIRMVGLGTEPFSCGCRPRHTDHESRSILHACASAPSSERMGVTLGAGVTSMIENWPREEVEYALRWWGRVLSDMTIIGFEGRRMGMRGKIESDRKSGV